jgi:hypothetical protein
MMDALLPVLKREEGSQAKEFRWLPEARKGGEIDSPYSL